MTPTPAAPVDAGRQRLIAGASVLLLCILLSTIYLIHPDTPRSFPPLPDFASYQQVADRKAAFINYLTPIVDYQNARILKDRDRLDRIAHELNNGRFIFPVDREWLRRLAEKYDVPWREDNINAVANELMGRVDLIPTPLVIVQAAKESSWGQSRFAVEGNNLFGHWCYAEDCGMEPELRPDGANHQVRRFKSVSNAVRAYLHNLNTHASYEKLRRIRKQLRADHLPVTGLALADGLMFYSEQREAYIEEVKAMIRQYHAFKKARRD